MKKIFLKITLLCLIYFYVVEYGIIACEPTSAQIDSVTEVRKGLDTLINRYEDFARTWAILFHCEVDKTPFQDIILDLGQAKLGCFNLKTINFEDRMVLLNTLLKDTFRHQVYIFSALKESGGIISNINTIGPFGFDSQLTIVFREKFELREFQKLINQFVDSYTSTMTIMPVAQDLITQSFMDWEIEEKKIRLFASNAESLYKDFDRSLNIQGDSSFLDKEPLTLTLEDLQTPKDEGALSPSHKKLLTGD